MSRLRPPSALVVVSGDDVYEDLFAAALHLRDLLVERGFAARTAMGTARLTDSAADDLIVLYTAMGDFPPAHQSALAEAVRAGAGLIAVHSANVFADVGGRLDEDYRQLFELIGSRFASHGPPPHESRFRVETHRRHVVTRGVAPFEITHEHYRIELDGDVQILAWRSAPAGREPIVYVRDVGNGRVCYIQLGHDIRAWGESSVREIVGRCADWAHRRTADVVAGPRIPPTPGHRS
jgi:type 1 glutamine amidotransferase